MEKEKYVKKKVIYDSKIYGKPESILKCLTSCKGFQKLDLVILSVLAICRVM